MIDRQGRDDVVKRLFRQPVFCAGFLFVFGLFTASVLYHLIWHDALSGEMFIYDEAGKLADVAPLPPSAVPPFGTDDRGYNLAIMLLIGAKYTLSIALIIAVIRMILSVFFGWLYGMYLYRLRRLVTALLDGIHYIPMTMLAYVILVPVLMEDGWYGMFHYSQTERIVFEIMILAVLAVPPLAVQIGNMIGQIRQREFIDSARVLGASRWQMFRRDILPHLLPGFSLIFMQQIIQVMIILAHLGILDLFFGGTDNAGGIGGADAHSTTSEWSGLIGLYFDRYLTAMWMFLAPIIMFTLTILAFTMMRVGIERALEGADTPSATVAVRTENPSPRSVSKDSFRFLRPSGETIDRSSLQQNKSASTSAHRSG